MQPESVKGGALLSCSLQHPGPRRHFPLAGEITQDRMQALAQAQPNIALVKYWGKRDSKLNLPAVGSLSITLDSLWTRTRVVVDPAFKADALLLDGRTARPAQLARVVGVLDEIRARAGTSARACVETNNNFPTGAGLASSASGFAALVVAATRAFELDLPPTEQSRIARRASGSAGRSIFGGYVEMRRGTAADGVDAHASPLLASSDWPLEVVVAVTSTQEKEVGSTEGMDRCARTSPYYDAWVRTHEDDLAAARNAIAARDFTALAAVSERSCLKMHAAALAADPGLLYWNGATVEALQCVRALRHAGVGTFFTIDAGPQVKAVCVPADAAHVMQALQGVPGVTAVLRSSLGGDARVLEASPVRASA
jgi:diphosphomevalonate decarboxylase